MNRRSIHGIFSWYTKPLLPKKIARIITKIYVFFLKLNSCFIDKLSCQGVKKSASMRLLVAKYHFRTYASIPKCHKVYISNLAFAFGVNFCRVRGPIPSCLFYFNLEFHILVLTWSYSFTLSYFLHIWTKNST